MITSHQQFDLLDKRVFEKATIKAPFRMIAVMPDEACFYYVMKGEGRVIAPEAAVNLKASEGIVLKCGNYINEYLCDQEFDECEVIAVHFNPDVLRKLYDRDLPDFLNTLQQIKPLPPAKVTSNSLLKSYIESLQFYFDHPELVSEELLRIKLKEIILLLAKTDSAQKIAELLASLFSPTVLDFKEVIESNIFQNLTMEELAALTHQSLSNFKRTFKELFGNSPARYIRNRRLDRAASLLASSSQQISHIAYDCAFKDVAHFSKTFQNRFGCSPTQYRMDHSDKSLN